MSDLDEQLVAAGMRPLSDLISNPMSPFHVHAGVNDMGAFAQWLEMRHEEMMTIRATMELDNRDDTELFEWVLSHAAAFSEVIVNFRAATRNNNGR